MLDLVGGMLAAALLLGIFMVVGGLGILWGLIVHRMLCGKYVDPSKVRHCGDIKDS